MKKIQLICVLFSFYIYSCNIDSNAAKRSALQDTRPSVEGNKAIYIYATEQPIFIKTNHGFNNLKVKLLQSATQLGIHKIDSLRFVQYNLDDYHCKRDSAQRYLHYIGGYLISSKYENGGLIIQEYILDERYALAIYNKYSRSADAFRKLPRPLYTTVCMPELYSYQFHYVAKRGNRLYCLGLGGAMANLTFPPPHFSVQDCMDQDSTILIDDIYELIQKSE